MTGMLTCKAVPYWYVFTNKSVQMFLTLRVKSIHSGARRHTCRGSSNALECCGAKRAHIYRQMGHAHLT